MTRVLIKNFDTIVGIGVRALLLESGFEVQESGAELADAIAELRPDALVVDLDDASASATSVELLHVFDEMALVLCSSERMEMRVYPRGNRAAARSVPPTPEVLIRAVSRS